MSYNPYNNYSKKIAQTGIERQKKELKKAEARVMVCDGVAIEKISTSKIKRMIHDSKGQGINFTDPCSGFGYGVISDTNETQEERMRHGKGVDNNIYYYK